MGTDFSSSLYLAMRHSGREIGNWASLTTGVPAAFSESVSAANTGMAIARLQGLESGLVAPSTLHLFWDWFGRLDPQRHVIFADRYIYRIAACGIERAAGKGVPVVRFRHNCAEALRSAIKSRLPPGRKPVVVTDGWCPICGQAAPLHAYLAEVDSRDGLVLVDDTQALGILGENPTPHNPYGNGGGGLLPFLKIKNARIIAISSLAKAFGTPMAVLCGARKEVDEFKQQSESRMFSSPPSEAAIAAANHALQLNNRSGTEIRSRLSQNVGFFRRCMAENGFEMQGGLFPVQTLKGLETGRARQLHRGLWQNGVRTVLVSAHGNGVKLCWLLSASHQESVIHAACQLFLSVFYASAPWLPP